jgi:hypothetical protein
MKIRKTREEPMNHNNSTPSPNPSVKREEAGCSFPANWKIPWQRFQRVQRRMYVDFSRDRK